MESRSLSDFIKILRTQGKFVRAERMMIGLRQKRVALLAVTCRQFEALRGKKARCIRSSTVKVPEDTQQTTRAMVEDTHQHTAGLGEESA